MADRAAPLSDGDGPDAIQIWWAPIPDTAQQGIFDDDTPEAKLLFAGGYGAGKTTTLVGKTLKLSHLNGDIPGIVLVPDYGHFEDTILEVIKSIDPQTGRRWFLEDSQFNYRITRHGAHIFEWDGGGPWHIMSAVRPDSLKGPQRAWMVSDEPGIVDYAAWRNAANRVRHPLARVRQTCGFGTSEGLNWLAAIFQTEHEDSYYRIYTMRTDENIELLRWQPGYIRQVLENATEQEAQSYLGGAIANLTGALAYSTFNRATHWREDVPVDPTLPLCITFDFNVDPMSCVLGQIVTGPTGRELNIIDAFIKHSSWTPEICDLIIAKYGREASQQRFGLRGHRGWPGGAVIYGDATGNALSTTSQKSNYDIIREQLGPQFPMFVVHSSVTKRVNPAEIDRLNAMRAVFKNALGKARCFIKKTHPTTICPTLPLVRSLEMTQIAPGTQHIHKPAGETHTHASDALGYLVAAEFPARKPQLVSAASFGNPDI